MARTLAALALALSFSAVLTAGQGAFATDLPPEVEAPEIAIGGSGPAGWYLRGDLGYAGWSDGGAPEFDTVSAGPTITTDGFDDARFGNPVSFSGGIGYQLNDMARLDLTTDYFADDFGGRATSSLPCAGGLANTGCGFDTEAGYKALGLMANAYVDLGTVVGLTPYVGGGLGATRLEWGGVTGSTFCIDGAASCAGSPAFGDTTYAGRTDWRLTWALMAGVSYDVASNLKLDFGYRYSRINGGDMFDFTAAEQALGASGAKGRDDGLDRHEFRVGLRMTTW